MSHFAVLVIGEDVEAALAPFQENNMGDCPREFLKFHDQEEEFRREYEEESREMIRKEDGSLAFEYDECFRVSGSLGMFSFGEQPSHVAPAHLERVKVPHKVRFATLEDFVRDFHGDEERDKEMGLFGYWENPNKKWDWWKIGGRYSDRLLKRDGTRVDSLQSQELDFEGLEKAARDFAGSIYDRVARVIGHLPPMRPWSEFYDSLPKQLDEARALYEGQPRVIAFRAAWRDLELGDESPEDFSVTREEYLATAERDALAVFAVVKDGRWFERGKMGWWATVSGEKDPETWRSIRAELLRDLPWDTKLTVVDCHI